MLFAEQAHHSSARKTLGSYFSLFTKRWRGKRKRVEGVIGNGKVVPEVIGIGSGKLISKSEKGCTLEEGL